MATQAKEGRGGLDLENSWPLIESSEQALEIARDLAEQKLAALQLRIKHTHRSRQRVLTGAH